VLCAITVTVAAVNVLWILMVGSVVATLGVLAIAILEAPPWFDRAANVTFGMPRSQLSAVSEVAAEAVAPISQG
jgi:hypothetical protein